MTGLTAPWTVGQRTALGAKSRSRIQTDDPTPLTSPGNLLLMTAWFGAITGLLELVQLLVRNHYSGGVSLGILQMNRHFIWMIPVADGLIFMACGLTLFVSVRVVPRRSARLAPLLPAFLTTIALLLTIPGLSMIACTTLAGGLAAGIMRAVNSHPRGFWRLMRLSLPVLLVCTAGPTAWGVLRTVVAERRNVHIPMAADPGPPNVLLIVMDTVRYESLSLHGYNRDTSPNLVRLAKRGVRFEQARTPAPWTLPAHASMFTGRWPHELNVGEDRPLDSTHPTLAEFFVSRGYVTSGFIANTYFCNSWYGLGRGFDRYEDFDDDETTVTLAETFRCSALGRRLMGFAGMVSGGSRPRKDAARINHDFLSWVSEQEQEHRPFFAFLNYFDAHTPYLLPDGIDRHFGLRPEGPADLEILRLWNERPKQNVTQREATLVHDAYDDCIAYLDDQLGKLFDELERRGMLINTLVIVTSDHGEQLGEHGIFGHGKSLYAQEVRVPLLIIPPGGMTAGMSVRDPVSLRDLAATVADVVNGKTPPPFPGKSLARYWTPVSSDRQPPEELVLSEVSLRMKVSRNPNRPPAWRGPMQSLVAEGKVYIRNADGREELYDLENDPSETHDLAASNDATPILERLRFLLQGVQRQGGARAR
jgi:arylsulfatase A-like enzyme